jgi:hypothetical protein
LFILSATYFAPLAEGGDEFIYVLKTGDKIAAEKLKLIDSH